jgi:hypothetical protein
MTLRGWAKNGWLKPHSSTQREVIAIFRVIDRDLEDARQNLSPDGRFSLGYNAALQLCTVALLAEGWRPERVNARYRLIAALPLIFGRTWQGDADFLEACRTKRNGLEYDAAGCVSVAEANRLVDLAEDLREVVAVWMGKRHPRLSPWHLALPSAKSWMKRRVTALDQAIGPVRARVGGK